MDHLLISNQVSYEACLLIQSPFPSDPFEAVVPDINIQEPDTTDRRESSNLYTRGKPFLLESCQNCIPETLIPQMLVFATKKYWAGRE